MVDRAQADGADPVTTASIRTVITARPAAPHVLVLTTYDTDADIWPPSKPEQWATRSKMRRPRNSPLLSSPPQQGNQRSPPPSRYS